MEKSILVAYASKYGATKEIAEKIGEELSAAGLPVDVQPADAVKQTDGYRAVILGSAIYIGKWQKEAEAFLKTNEKALTGRPLWLFSSGPSGEGNPLELVEGALVPEGLKALVGRLQPRDIAIFHGNIDPARLNAIEKWAVKSVVKKPFGDYRDWGMIRAWAAGIAGALRQ